jgi:3-hydroxy-9,10-secoandrosta-1,3,5(10)-triene-9,17-dione monooxygenase
MSALNHDPAPAPGELVSRAEALQGLLLEHAPRGDTSRRVAPEVIRGLAEAGLLRLMKPPRFGGIQTDLRLMTAITEALGKGDGSAAWVVGVFATGAWIASHVSEKGLHEVFAANPDARIAGVSSEVLALRVHGGIRISGRWGYASGADYADWVAIGTAIQDSPDQPATSYFCLVPASELILKDTWQTIGMRGTGSNTFVADNMFVPEHRIINLKKLTDGDAANNHIEKVYRLPFAPVATIGLIGPLLGIGCAALQLVIDAAKIKGIAFTTFTRQIDSVGVQLQVADAALKLRTARMHVYDIADQSDSAPLNDIDRARFRAQSGLAAQWVIEALNILMNVHGFGAFAEAERLQRLWRDANTGARHAGLNSAIGSEMYGKALLGVDEFISPIV